MSSETGFWDTEAMASPLSDREKELRDRFVEEYMFDFDPVSACLRCGFLSSMAKDYAAKFMDEPYVVQSIAKRQRELAADPKVEEELTKRQIRASLLREAHFRGIGSSHAARVAALTRLSSQYGMDAPLKIKADHKMRGGVMMVPAVANLEEWQAAALASQGQLVSDTQDEDE